MSNIIKNFIKTELSFLENKFLKSNQFPLSVVQYDYNDVYNSMKTFLRDGQQLGMKFIK